MAEIRDDSLLFSLKGLDELQRQRIDRDAATAKARADAARAARLRAERERRDAETRRIEAEAARRREQERERRAQDRRFEAMRTAMVERARAEVTAAGQAALLEQQHAHELSMARIRAAAEHRRRRVALWGASVAAALSTSAAIALAAQARHEGTVVADLDGTLALERQRRRHVETELNGARRRIALLERQVAALPAVAGPVPASRARDIETSKGSPARVPTAVPKLVDHPSPTPVRCGADGDPLDGCLP